MPAAEPPPPPPARPVRRPPAPPETPPLLDPTLRYPRLTPNLREMIHGFSQGIHDPSDFLASPDPAAMYASLQIGSPILRDFYSVPSSHPSYDYTDRPERMTGACAEMNALFTNCYPSTNPDSGYRSDGNHDPSVISLMSSPEMPSPTIDASASGVSSSDQNHKLPTSSGASQTSSQTPPPLDTSSSSPSNSSPDVPAQSPDHKSTSTANPPGTSSLHHHTTSPTSSKHRKLSHSNSLKPKRPSARSSAKSASVSGSQSGSGSGSGSASASASATATAKTQTTTPQQPQIAMSTAASAALMAANAAAAMNPNMAGLMPFACAMPPGMGHMLPAPGTVHYQGRPMAFVAGAHGTELIPIDMLAQATAMQYGAAAAQAAVTRMMQPMVGQQGAVPMRTAPQSFEPVGGSRKKRRRQLLERSECSEEQARQNRAHALERLREKKTLRSQQSTVRYACRKRIAMVRPRVNGRFATKEEVEETQRTEKREDV